jgi:hypothetical protein
MPSNTSHAGTPADLLNDMRRLHASLVLMQSSYVGEEMLNRLEGICDDLEEALIETDHLEKRRRSTTIERRMAEDACQRAIDETTRLLKDTLGVVPTIQIPTQSVGSFV